MSLELVINSASEGVDVALLNEKKIVELHQERGSDNYSVGDIYLGKVRKVVPSLNAAFIDVGYEKDAFLHYLDLGPQFKSLQKLTTAILHNKGERTLSKLKLDPDIDKSGKIGDVLSSSQQILVQVAKEPISSKGPRLSSEITLAGRYVVLVPFSNKISVSQKIRSADEKARLRRLLTSICPKNFGVIIRTVAQDKKVAELDQDLRDLLSKWEKLTSNLKNSKPPKRVLGELNRTSSILRDLLTPEFTGVHVNDEGLFNDLNSYISTISPGREKILKRYSGKKDIFEHFGLHRQIKASFGRQVNMPSGAYLIIEHTEAMHVVDVNSGNRVSKGKSQEENALETNLEAAEELARILRLRDMGGIIAVDFIDMQDRENQKKLHNHLRDCMRSDRAKHNVLAPSKFGVVEITRQRVRPVTEIDTSEPCPCCDGSGNMTSSILLLDELENKLKYMSTEMNVKNTRLVVHPFIASHLNFKTSMFGKTISRDWSKKHAVQLRVDGNASFQLMQYKFEDDKGERIDI